MLGAHLVDISILGEHDTHRIHGGFIEKLEHILGRIGDPNCEDGYGVRKVVVVDLERLAVLPAHGAHRVGV